MTKDEFYVKWLEAFASDIPEKEIEKYVVSTGNLLWHVFSWELLDGKLYLSGVEAKNAYDSIDKRGASYIEWFSDERAKEITSDLTTAKALDQYVEVYVVGKDFAWTYIKTHESSCGPYFLCLK